MKAKLSALESKVDSKPPIDATVKPGISGVTGRSQCDFCRRTTCPLITGDGRPCRQYHKALENWRLYQKEQKEANPDGE